MPTDELRVLDLTLPTPAENLACDEALLDWCDDGGMELLRFWEPTATPPCYVVLGYANRVAREVLETACAESGVPIYRRCTGGGAVLQGPGCLNYSLVLQINRRPALASVTETNRYIMERQRAAVEALLAARREDARRGSREDKVPAQVGIGRPREAPRLEPPYVGCYGGDAVPALSPPSVETVEVQGHTDLVCDGRKFSGNAQRRKRRALLFHGTFLCDLDLAQVGRFLAFPSRPPDYRQGRNHQDFLMNLPLPPTMLKAALSRAWQAGGPLANWPQLQTQRLATEKYETRDWSLKF